MEAFLDDIEMKDPVKPVIANVTAQPVGDSSEIKRLLVEQITSPVRWSQTMGFLKENSVTKTIEIGPGKVLNGLAKRDMRPEKSINLDTLTDIKQYSSVSIKV